jgi:hypothetical protein
MAKTKYKNKKGKSKTIKPLKPKGFKYNKKTGLTIRKR